MTKRIFKSICAVTLVMVLVSLSMMVMVSYHHFTEIELERLASQTQLGAHGVATQGMDYLEDLHPKGYRITWVDVDGSVRYDSEADVASMENHGNREEIREAFVSGYGESSRSSATVLENQIYAAQRLKDGSVIRVSNTQGTMLAFVLPMLQPILMIVLVIVIVSLLLAYRLSKGIIRPLNDLDLDRPLSNEAYEEISPLLTRIEHQHQEIDHQIQELGRRQEEFKAITENMVEGLILLNEKGMILTMNHSATTIFATDMDCIGKDMFTVNRSLILQELLEKSMKGNHGEKVMPLTDGIYQIGCSPIVSDGKVLGVVILVLDVTAKADGEKMRQEFTANVSHELKTPLHSISGCAELLKNNLVATQDVPKFTQQIYGEAQRMILLVDDIIRLSHLDEGGEDLKREMVDLTSIVEETMESLALQGESAHISLEFQREVAPVMVLGIARLLTGLVYNLCDNAIKYNRPNGKVTVTLEAQQGAVLLGVSDTGIGIAEEHRNRIFQRFYRVDKSRSKEMGGTGLGLSIVKHAASIHNGELAVQSIVGVGTTITVRFKV